MQRSAHALHVFITADLVIVSQAHLHERSMGRGIARINRGEAGRRANVRSYQSQIMRRHRFAHDVFDLFHFSLGRFEASTCCRFQINDKLSGIGSWKVGNAQCRSEDTC